MIQISFILAILILIIYIFARRVSVSARPLNTPYTLLLLYMMGWIKTLLNLGKQYILAAYVHLEEFRLWLQSIWRSGIIEKSLEV